MDRDLKNTVRADYERLLNRERLATTAKVEKLIYFQTVEGHAHNGHGEFRQKRYVDMTIADVVRAVGADTVAVKRARQDLVDDIFRWAERATAGDASAEELCDGDGKPLLAIPFLKDFVVQPAAVLKGMYMGGLRDNSRVRDSVAKEHGVVIGGGECYVVDTKVMCEMDLDSEKLSHDAHGENVEEYRRRGLIVDIPDKQVDDDRYRYLYIRDRVGPGHSDDGAVVFAGMLWGRDCALGVFLADAIDTIEKYSEKYADQDDALAQLVKDWKGFDPAWEKDMRDLTFLALQVEDRDDDIPDSSLRYFIRIDNESNRCAIQNHLDFIEGRATVPMLLGFDRVLSPRFYRYVHERLVSYQGETTATRVGVPPVGTLAGVVDRNFILVRVTDSPAQIMDKFVSSNAEVAVVLDDGDKVVGTLRALDLLRLMWGWRKQ